MKFWRRWFPKKRTKEERLLSLMNAGWFLSMYGNPNEVMLCKSAYANLEKNVKNNTLEATEALLCAVRDRRIKELTAGGGRPS